MGYEYYIVNFAKKQYVYLGKRGEDIEHQYLILFDILHDLWPGQTIKIISHEHAWYDLIMEEYEDISEQYAEKDDDL